MKRKAMRGMTLHEAQHKARTLWRAHAGWADLEIIEVDGDGKPTRWSCTVGIRTNHGQGSQRVTLGRGQSFDAAFESAERRLARETEPRRRRREQRGFPTVEMFPEGRG